MLFGEVEFDDPGEIPDLPAAFVNPLPPVTGAPDAPPDAPPPPSRVALSVYRPVFGAKPKIVFPDVPTYGDLTSGIPFPTMRDIVLPPPPDVDFGIPFTGTKPVFLGTPPDAADFDYTEQAYDPLLVSEIKTAIQSMLAGTTGLPRVVEELLWARQAEREAEQAAAAVQDALSEFSTRGFTLPSGPLQSKLMQVRQNSQNQKNTLGRDVMIRVHEVLVDQFKFGVAQGIALENTWIQLYSDIQNRRLQAAQVGVNIAISVYNALVAQYQAQAEVYKTEAQVHAALIQAELSKLQAYGEQLRALQLIGQLNQQDVEIYRARLGAIETNVRLYVAEIEAYTALTNGEKLKLDVFRTEIDVEQAKLSSSAQEIQIFNGQLQGDELVQRSYQIRAQTYLGNIQAWKTKYEAQIERQRGEIAVLEAETARYVGRIQGITAKVNYQTAKGQAIIADNTAKVQKYEADSRWTGSYNSALAEKIKMLNDANAQNTQIALKNGEINAQNGFAIGQLQEQAIAQSTQVMAQMASSFASSVNMNASVSDSANFSGSCNYSTSQVM